MFENMIFNLTTNDTSADISLEEYENFCKEFIFDKLRGIKFGRSFCDKFNISHNIIPQLSDEGAKEYIEKNFIGEVNV